MKKVKMKSFVMLLLVAIGTLALVFGASLTQTKREVSATSPNNIITAVIAGNPIDTALPNFRQAGQVVIGLTDIRLNGTDVYEIESTATLSITVVPGKHFEFNPAQADIKMRIQRINNSGTIVEDAPLAGATTTLTPITGFNYVIVANIIPKAYQLTLETYYLDNTPATTAQAYFLANNAQPASITWGSLNLRGVECNYTLAGENFRIVSARIQYRDNTNFDEISLGNTFLSDHVLDSHVKPDGRIIIRGMYTRVVAINITTNVSGTTRNFEENIQIESNSRVTGIQRIENGIGPLYFDSGSHVTISVKNTGGFTFQQFVIGGTAKPELGAKLVDTNLTSNLSNIRVDFAIALFDLFLVGLDHLNSPFELGTNASVTVTNASGVATTYYANREGGIPICPLSTLRFNHNPGTLDARYENPTYFIKGKPGVANKEIQNLSQTIPVDDEFIDKHISNGQAFFTVLAERKFKLTITLSSEFAGSVLVNGEAYDPNRAYSENELITLAPIENKYHTFIRFDGASEEFRVGNTDINVHAIYVADTFKIQETKNFLFSGAKDGTATISVGMKLTITYSGQMNGGIDGWTINGKSLSHFGAERNGRSVTLTVTPEFIDTFEKANWVDSSSVLKFDNNVSTKTGGGVVVAIAVPCILALAAVACFVMISLGKQKPARQSPTQTKQDKKE